MKQVIEELKTGSVRVVDTPVAHCGPNELLIRTVASLISAGTEKLMIEMGKKSLLGKAKARPDLVRLAFEKGKREGFYAVFREAMARLDEPLPLGYSSAGVVHQVGNLVRGFRVGDAVACAGHGVASHAEFILVPPELCHLLPNNADGQTIPFDQAAFVMIGGIALQGIRSANPTFGESVAVIGLGLIGLLTVQIAEAYGCNVIGIDVNSEKVQLARQLGCRHVFLLGGDEVEGSILNITNGRGVDSVVLTAATNDNAPILLAERIARSRGRIVLVGVSDLSLTRKAFWEKELAFTVSKGSGPSPSFNPSHSMLPPEFVRWTEQRNLEEFLRLLAAGSVRVNDLITHRFKIHEALGAYEMILNGKENYIGVLIGYEDSTSEVKRIHLKPATKANRASRRMNLGVVGAGMFAKNVLLPAIRKVTGVHFVGVATKSGLSSRHIGSRFGFEYATTEFEDLLKDERIGSIVISTRHNLHAKMILRSLEAGKNVFVEKPLCIHPEELGELQHAEGYLGDRTFLVGFNRRHSPLAVQLKGALIGRTAPLQIQVRVNAGFIPADHWTQDLKIGGGRIVGEVCHFVDFLQFLTDADPVEVHAVSIGGSTGKYLRDDNASLSLRFADGSIGTILYTTLGPKTFGRERVELYWGETVAVLDDFRSLLIVRGARRKRIKLWSQDMGYVNEMKLFLSGTVDSAEVFRQAVRTTQATFAALQSLATGKPASI